jgi:uncharacterized protein YqjF (DUF2071 family)
VGAPKAIIESAAQVNVLAGRPWLMRMQWNDLCFLHWRVDAAQLRSLIPKALNLDTFAGEAWLGITPFWMSGVRPRLLPPIPGMSTFPELNVRTYVSLNHKPGIWFFSLDADNSLAVRGARTMFYLPYFRADMAIDSEHTGFRYSSIRGGKESVQFMARYWPTGPVFHSAPGTLEFFLTERYCLYVANKEGKIFRGDISHRPWPLQRADAEIEINTMASAAGITLPSEPPTVHFAENVDVRAWYLVEDQPRAH